jgi:metal-sulfur cluster biosynthetic enzyme
MSSSSARLRRAEIASALARVLDPEVGVDVVALGLVYEIEVDEDVVHVAMTMTSPSCPLSESIEREVREAVGAVAPPGTRVDVAFVWDPIWRPAFMSDAARERLGWRGR